MSLYQNKRYLEDVHRVAEADLPWEKLQDRSILLSGATGLLGSFLVDVVMQKNTQGLNCTVYALSRTEARARERFSAWWGEERLVFLPYDVNQPFV